MFFKKKKQIPYTPQFNEIPQPQFNEIPQPRKLRYTNLPATKEEILLLNTYDLIMESLVGRSDLSAEERKTLIETATRKTDLSNEIMNRVFQRCLEK